MICQSSNDTLNVKNWGCPAASSSPADLLTSQAVVDRPEGPQPHHEPGTRTPGRRQGSKTSHARARAQSQTIEKQKNRKNIQEWYVHPERTKLFIPAVFLTRLAKSPKATEYFLASAGMSEHQMLVINDCNQHRVTSALHRRSPRVQCSREQCIFAQQYQPFLHQMLQRDPQ